MVKTNKFLIKSVAILIGLLGIGLLISTVIVFQIFQPVDNLVEGYQSQGWSSVTGIVTNSSIYSIKGRSGYTFEPQVFYKYSVLKNVYTGKTISFRYLHLDQSYNTAETKVAKYATGSQVKVFYNPNSPNISCLESGFYLWENLLVLLFCIFFGGCSIFFIAIAYRMTIPKNM